MKEKILKIMPLTAIIGLFAGAIGGYIYYLKSARNQKRNPSKHC